MNARYLRTLALRAVLSRQIGNSSIDIEKAIQKVNDAVDKFAAQVGDNEPTDAQLKTLSLQIEIILDESNVPYEYVGH